MSNLSSVGFHVESEEDLEKLAEKAYELAVPLETSAGTYVYYTEKSGAELWLQLNQNNELVGLNPHFKGKSRRQVCLTAEVERLDSELDGAFHSWADPAEPNDPDSGICPFVFDVPDFKAIGEILLPQSVDIQLSAFAQEFEYFDSEEDYQESQKEEPKWASQSFVPSGLFSPDEECDPNPPQAYGIFSGIIKEYEKKTNQLTGHNFYWLLVDTLGGEIDVVADMDFFDKKPILNGVVSGQFWLSGQLLTQPKLKQVEQKRGFLFKIFGKHKKQ